MSEIMLINEKKPAVRAGFLVRKVAL